MHDKTEKFDCLWQGYKQLVLSRLCSNKKYGDFIEKSIITKVEEHEKDFFKSTTIDFTKDRETMSVTFEQGGSIVGIDSNSELLMFSLDRPTVEKFFGVFWRLAEEFVLDIHCSEKHNVKQNKVYV